MKPELQEENKPQICQKYLGEKGTIGLIVLLSAFVPLSTDLYLPALPGMVDYFGVPVMLVNLTLILFFIVFSAGMLFWGPLSDKYGRRPILFRAIQAAGGSAASAVATAMVKDLYAGRKQESVLAIVQSMVVISPAVAPVLGAFMLPYTSWQGLFWMLGLIGIVSLTGGVLLEEPLTSRYTGTIVRSFGRLGTVLKNPGFTSLLIVFSLVSTASLAFITDSSYIFVNQFGLSEQWYSFYFAVIAVGMISGPFLYLRLSRYIRRNTIIVSCFAIMAVSGVMICLFGDLGPVAFTLALFPASMIGSCVRPSGTFLMLQQQKEDTGSASSLINCSGLLFGSAGMVLVSVGGDDLILSIGIINFAVGLMCLSGFMLIRKLHLAKEVPDFVGKTD
ncbi:major facilitator superfamily MFS_1 [Methanolacinia petrolearia DSM 11571]|uniref:Major facilitator superfamily MFS_1 n=1 Tax=Methanolacinia petrolearia (strain DSM 11571 / OCM 486 / SEBR 4847) TaxID=679926 RepID=E1RK51_METP4|nr:MFS transporter [Methanolacinia petrolearia]ADN35774.1 major facilitator superfamily MFS_1 [Methanolacinia petrolearia DSM 11571]